MFKFLRRFFEPAINTKAKTLKLFLDTIISFLWYDLLPIISIPILIGYINNSEYDQIKQFSILILGITFLLLIFQFFTTKWPQQSKFAFEGYLTNKYFIKSILKDPTTMDQIGTGKIQSIVKTGITSWAESNYGILSGLTRVITGTATGIYILFQFDLKYVPYFILIIIITATGYYYASKMKLKYDERIVSIENDIDKDYVRVIMSRQEVILATNETKESDKIILGTRKQMKENNVGALYDHLSEVFVSGIGITLPLIGALFLLQDMESNAIPAAFLISFVYFCSRFSSSLYNMAWAMNQMFDFYPKINKLWDFLDTTPAFENYYKGEKFVHGNGTVELRDINFSYSDKKILESFNLKIDGGKKVALVGKSGSGKTTLAKLITGFITPHHGQVLIDGQDISQVALKSYYKYIGYLTQEPMVFDGTVKDNLLYSLPDDISRSITDTKLYDALKKAECDFITDLHTEIGEKGVRLSGGERQRLAIAKLMLKNPEIIILDEPTSALDSFSEDAITRALDVLFKNKTVIIIAHRLQTVKKADTIIVLESGRIIEQGTNDELVKHNGQYKKMLKLQSF